MEPICSICGKSTYAIDIDYLVGHDHLVCLLKENNKVKTKLKIQNPHHINCKNYLLDGSFVEISYTGLEERINASDKIPYTIFKFEGIRNNTFSKLIKFELHTTIISNKVQMNVWKGFDMSVGSVYVDTIKDKDALRNYMIEEVKKY
jgi:hypothetical protein